MFAELAAIKEAADRALMHHGDPVADADHLLHVAGDHEDGDAGIGQRAHQLVDLVLGADIDAPGRLVEDHAARLHRQPFGQHDLLLVAARHGPHLRGDAGRLDPEALALTLGIGGFARRADELHPGVGIEIGQRDIGGQRDVEQQAQLLAVLRHQIDAALDGLARGAHLDGRPAEAQGSRRPARRCRTSPGPAPSGPSRPGRPGPGSRRCGPTG